MLITVFFYLVYYLSIILTRAWNGSTSGIVFALNYVAYGSLVASYFFISDLPDILLPLSAVGLLVGLSGLLGSRWGAIGGSLLASVSYYTLLFLLDKLSKTSDHDEQSY